MPPIESDKSKEGFVGGLLVGVFMMLMFLAIACSFSYSKGYNQGVYEHQCKAVQAGVGTWVSDDKGRSYFGWLKPGNQRILQDYKVSEPFQEDSGEIFEETF